MPISLISMTNRPKKIKKSKKKIWREKYRVFTHIFFKSNRKFFGFYELHLHLHLNIFLPILANYYAKGVIIIFAHNEQRKSILPIAGPECSNNHQWTSSIIIKIWTSRLICFAQLSKQKTIKYNIWSLTCTCTVVRTYNHSFVGRSYGVVYP